VRLPTPASPGAAARRSLLADLLAALLIATVAIILAAGIGVVGFIALIAALVLLPWYLVEALVRLLGRRRRRRAEAGVPERRDSPRRRSGVR
jgi:NhaP-type Na+/H+ or K+/H+ antiporter